MNKMFYSKLAINNISKNKRIYVPYILTCIFTVMISYMTYTLSHDDGLNYIAGGDVVKTYLLIGNAVIAIFSTIFLFYANNFIIKNRKKEFGLFNILGLGKKHISIVVSIETIIIGVISLVLGIFLGLILSKASLLLLLKILRVNVQFGFRFSFDSFITTSTLFIMIYGLILLNSIRQIYFSKTIDLLKSDKMGEKEPKTKIIMTLLGLISLGIGYCIAIFTKDPVAAALLFFIAVMLVIIGTYLLFTAGSIFMLKIMRKNKRFYYKTKNFISISSMIYRMKQSAVGLASICILSTMVLVTLSSTVCLFVGMDDILETRFPYDISVDIDVDEYKTKYGDKANDYINNINSTIKGVLDNENITKYKFHNFDCATIVVSKDGNELKFSKNNSNYIYYYYTFYVITESEFNDSFKKNINLNNNEVTIITDDDNVAPDITKFEGLDFTVNRIIDSRVKTPNSTVMLIPNAFLVVKDKDTYNKFVEVQQKYYSNNEVTNGVNEYKYIGIDYQEDSDKKQNTFNEISKKLENCDFVILEYKENYRQECYSTYGGLFFIGIFLGSLFMMATVLLMYYKQISEGYDDKRRFVILQQVGMSKSEVRTVIKSQILKVFFLPLIIAGIHTSFAFPIINRVMVIIGVMNTELFIKSTIGTYLVFAVFYIVVYFQTAKSYYRIVE